MPATPTSPDILPGFLTTPAPASARCPRSRLLLAHGAGAGMDSAFLETLSGMIAAHGIDVIRFEFDYMAARRTLGKRRPPPKAERLVGEYERAVRACGDGAPLLIGGKSLGGRVASLLADRLHAQGIICGLVCIGYPFHPPRKPASLRTAHLSSLTCPTLIVQGEADPLGSRDEVATYSLSHRIRFHWIASGDHDLAPKAGGGLSRKEGHRRALEGAATAVAEFSNTL